MLHRNQLIDLIARDYRLSRSLAARIYNKIFLSIEKSLTEGDDVKLPGFGQFRAVDRDSRVRMNPQTGDKIHVPARRVVKFYPATQLRREVNFNQDTATRIHDCLICDDGSCSDCQDSKRKDGMMSEDEVDQAAVDAVVSTLKQKIVR